MAQHPFFDHHRAREVFQNTTGKRLKSGVSWHRKLNKSGLTASFYTDPIECETGIKDARYYFNASAAWISESGEFGEINFTLYGGPCGEKHMRLLGLDVAPPNYPLMHPCPDRYDAKKKKTIIHGCHMHLVDRRIGDAYAEPVDLDRDLASDPTKGWLQIVNLAFLQWGIIKLSPKDWDTRHVTLKGQATITGMNLEEGL